MTQSITLGPGWWMRFFRVRAGLGTGADAVTIDTVIEGPEYLGPFGNNDSYTERQTAQSSFFVEALARRFPGEKITLLQLTPLAQRQPFDWDKRD